MSNAVRRAARPGGKWFLVFSIGLVAFVSGLYACSDTPANSVAPHNATAAAATHDKRNDRNPYAYVGEEHNAQVDHVLREFSKRWKKNMKQAEVCTVLDKISRDYLAGKGRSAYDFRSHSAGDLCRNENQSRSLDENGRGKGALVAYDPSFSPQAIDMVNQIEAIMLNSTSAADVANRLVPINNLAMATLGGSDAALVLGVSSIAQSSSAYWEANLDTWVTVYRQGGNPPVMPFSRSGDEEFRKTGLPVRPEINWNGIREVGWADVGGGIVGGIRGVFGGPGGVLIGAATGAAYASIGAAIGQIIKVATN